MKRIAIISVHGCPLAHVGEKDTVWMSISSASWPASWADGD